MSMLQFHFGLGKMGESMEMWINIDPHLLLYTFLPALLFGDAMAIDTHLLTRKLKEILILASVGVIIGTVLTASVTKYILPYDFSWNLCLLMGSILAATDPVAVVGLLKELGAPPTLTMVIAGESMFNDGTAIVVFNLFLSLYSKEMDIPGGFTDHAYTKFGQVAFYAFKSVFGGMFFGVVGGFISVMLLQVFDNKLHENNALLQLTTTLSMAYLVFYVAEGLYGTSGVIATVSLGMVFSEYSRGLIVSHEVLGAGWETFEFVGNTLIFSLAGCISGRIVVDASMLKSVDRYDVLWVMVSWFFSFITRMIMLIMIHPLMLWCRKNEWKNPSSNQSDLKDMLVEGWGGLRGAVGLALAILVRNQNVGTSEEPNGTLLLVHVTGVSALTLLVNATTAAPLLKFLGLTKVGENHTIAVNNVHRKILSDVRDFSNHLISGHNEDWEFSAMNDVVRTAIKKKEVAQLCSILQEAQETEEQVRLKPVVSTPLQREGDLWEKRELFMKLVRAEYNEMVDHRAIILPPERHNASRILLNSTLAAMDNLSNLGDWEFLKYHMDSDRLMVALLKMQDATVRFFGSGGNAKLTYIYKKRQDVYAMLLAFEKAHIEAEEGFLSIFGSGDVDALKVVEESRKTTNEAREMRKSMDKRLRRRVSIEHLAARILLYERAKVTKFIEGEVLLGKDEHRLLSGNEKDFIRLKKKNDGMARELAQDATFHNLRLAADERSSTIYIPKLDTAVHPELAVEDDFSEEEGGEEDVENQISEDVGENCANMDADVLDVEGNKVVIKNVTLSKTLHSGDENAKEKIPRKSLIKENTGLGEEIMEIGDREMEDDERKLEQKIMKQHKEGKG